jgi:hypothetical protein
MLGDTVSYIPTCDWLFLHRSVHPPSPHPGPPKNIKIYISRTLFASTYFHFLYVSYLLPFHFLFFCFLLMYIYSPCPLSPFSYFFLQLTKSDILSNLSVFFFTPPTGLTSRGELAILVLTSTFLQFRGHAI